MPGLEPFHTFPLFHTHASAKKFGARVFLRMKASIVSVVSAVKLLRAASPGHERSTLSMLEFA